MGVTPPGSSAPVATSDAPGPNENFARGASTTLIGVATSTTSAVRTAVNGSIVTFTWQSPVSGAAPTSYVVEAGSAAGLANIAQLDTGSGATTLSVSAVPAGTYYVRLRSRRGTDVSAL